MDPWKAAKAGKLGRHPLSAEYPDWPSDLHDEVVDVIREQKQCKRTVVLHEGLVLDGWQTLQCCVEAGVTPKFARLARGVNAEQFVRIANELRRHEDEATIILRAEKRRKRVAAARAEGKSTRMIAEEENVSQATVREDLKKVTEQGCSVNPESGKVKGKDGREQPASKPDTSASILCKRCTRAGPAKDCQACEDLHTEHRYNSKHRPKAGKGKRKSGSVLFDWQEFDRDFGGVVRQVDKLGRVGDCMESAQHKHLHKLLADFHDGFKALAKHALHTASPQ